MYRAKDQRQPQFPLEVSDTGQGSAGCMLRATFPYLSVSGLRLVCSHIVSFQTDIKAEGKVSYGSLNHCAECLLLKFFQHTSAFLRFADFSAENPSLNLPHSLNL